MSDSDNISVYELLNTYPKMPVKKYEDLSDVEKWYYTAKVNVKSTCSKCGKEWQREVNFQFVMENTTLIAMAMCDECVGNSDNIMLVGNNKAWQSNDV